ncbi:MAG TPA: tetratricopeptide repeat-containing sensor histidine kinase [Haliscomenobacter sp.]|uniref:ATP-binding protein n=1 Tax=Haliscomenobacter sp. TaxID=2717303 RepID=UPI002C059BDB|nr:tetratricopeptide repeat-containing sensor histidine kinase [Haliscomenobacter sp.]HOY20627.1 tetratricopeptide repeat-containing sensor histidine kinase [Haliscomenobacter sp.]
MPNRFLFILYLLLACAWGIPAQNTADSLIQLLPQTKNDTARARLYKAIADNLEDRTQALVYAKRGLDLVKKMKWSKGIGVFNGIFGRIYIDQGDYNQAESYIRTELDIHQQNRDSFNIASALNALGNIYSRQGQSTPALNTYLQALKIAEPARLTTLLPVIFNNISIIYSNQSHFDKAFSYEYKALQQNQKNKDTLGIAANYAGLATLHQLKTDTTKALTYFQRSIELLSRTKKALPKLAEAYQNQALLYRSVSQRLKRQLQAQAIWDQSLPAHQLSITNLGNIAWTYLDIAKQDAKQKNTALQQATSFYQRAESLADSVEDEGNLHYLLSLKAVLEATKGKHAAAYEAMYQYHVQYDSIYSQESKNKLAEAESNFFLEKKDAEIAIQKLTISNQRKIQWAFALGSLLLVVIAFLFYRLSQIRRKSNQQLLELNQSLDRANRQKAQLLAVLSHDLRHPLSNLISLLHLQKNAPDLLTPEIASQNQARITTNTEMLLENLENMLLWSKEQMNQASVERQNVSVVDLFQRLYSTFSGQDQLQWELDCPADFEICTDSNYLWIVLQNLSSNASKALKNQSDGKIKWKAWSSGAQKYLSIEDNGPGFPPNILQGSTEVQNEILLNGFGLQVVHDFAQKLGIVLQFENVPGAGAKVILKMPP